MKTFWLLATLATWALFEKAAVQFQQPEETTCMSCNNHRMSPCTQFFDYSLSLLLWPEIPKLMDLPEYAECPPEESSIKPDETCDVCGQTINLRDLKDPVQLDTLKLKEKEQAGSNNMQKEANEALNEQNGPNKSDENDERSSLKTTDSPKEDKKETTIDSKSTASKQNESIRASNDSKASRSIKEEASGEGQTRSSSRKTEESGRTSHESNKHEQESGSNREGQRKPSLSKSEESSEGGKETNKSDKYNEEKDNGKGSLRGSLGSKSDEHDVNDAANSSKIDAEDANSKEGTKNEADASSHASNDK